MSRNKIINDKIKDERREQILAAALKLFAVKGLSASRASDISELTGISQGLIYHYFRSKEDIFTSLIARAYDTMNEAALGLEQKPLPAKEKIIIAITELLKGIELTDAASTYYFLITQASMSESVPTEARKIIEEKNSVKHDVMQRIFKQGQAEGSVKGFDALHMSTVFWSLINGLAINKAINPARYTTPNREMILGLFLKDY